MKVEPEQASHTVNELSQLRVAEKCYDQLSVVKNTHLLLVSYITLEFTKIYGLKHSLETCNLEIFETVT